MIALFLLSLIPNPVVVDEVAVIERNQVYNQTSGELTGDYVIFWEFRDNEMRVREWRCTREVGTLGKVLEFWDSKAKVNRRIEGRVYVETQTWYDKETNDRQYLPEARRRKLRSK